MMSLELRQLHGSLLLPSSRRQHLHPQLRLSASSSADLFKRRSLFGRIVIASIVQSSSLSALSAPVKGMETLPYKPEGYNYWNWRNRKVHYVVQGEGPPVVLVHGFGASAFHWRYNIPELAKRFSVYAVDLLGFGWSEKALIDYDANLWKDQVADFIKDVVRGKAVLVGNRFILTRQMWMIISWILLSAQLKTPMQERFITGLWRATYFSHQTSRWTSCSPSSHVHCCCCGEIWILGWDHQRLIKSKAYTPRHQLSDYRLGTVPMMKSLGWLMML